MPGGGELVILMSCLLTLALLVAVAWVINRIAGKRRQRPRTYPQCGACGYDLTGTLGSFDRCPECGGGLAEVGVVPVMAPLGRGEHPGISPGERAIYFIFVVAFIVAFIVLPVLLTVWWLLHMSW